MLESYAVAVYFILFYIFISLHVSVHKPSKKNVASQVFCYKQNIPKLIIRTSSGQSQISRL